MTNLRCYTLANWTRHLTFILSLCKPFFVEGLCNYPHRSPFPAGTTQPLLRYILSHPLGITRSNKRERNVHNYI